MQLALRTASCATRRLTRLQISSVVLPASAFSRSKQPFYRLSSTGFKSASKHEVKENTDTPPKSQYSSVHPFPTPPPPLKGTPPTITTRDIEEYVQPLYSRGWGLSPILPNGNGIAVLRKRFEFGSAGALEAFLADLREYEEKVKHHAKTNVFEDQRAVLVSTWTHVARRRMSGADVKDNDEKTQGVTARDIRLAYALEGWFERALAAGGEVYVPRVRPEAEQPKTVEELEGYS